MSENSGFQKSSNRLPKEPLIVAALIVMVSVSLAVGGIVFKTQDSLRQDKVDFLADANQKQVAPLRRVIQLRLAQDKARLIQFAATRSSLGPGRARSFGDFALVSMVSPTTGGQWGLSWIEKGPLYAQLQSAQVMLTSDQEVALLKSLPYDRIREGDVHWQRLSDKSGRPIWALAVSVETQARGTSKAGPSAESLPEGTDYRSVQIGTGGRAVVVGFFGRNPLLSATEDFIGSTSNAFVVDSRGYAATHSNKTMVGAMLREDPSVKEVFSARSSAGTTRYQIPQGPKIFSAFEQVDRANLYVVISTPETAASSSSGQSFNRTALTTGGLALVVGLFLIFAWGTRLLPQAAVLSPQAALRIPTGPSSGVSSGISSGLSSGISSIPSRAARGREVQPSVEFSLEDLPASETKRPAVSTQRPDVAIPVTSEIALGKDRAEFVGHFVTGLERGMKEPLLAAMAHVQLVKVKSGDTPSVETMMEISEHISSVERDLRRAKEIIDELSQLSSTSLAPSRDERADVHRLLTTVLDQHRASLSEDGIALKVSLSNIPLIRGREEPLRKAIFEVLKNARRSLQGRSNKVIHVNLEDNGDFVKLKISDNGVGMDRETKMKAFDPFFHGNEDAESRGLGLSIVRAVVLAHGGQVELKSSIGDGTTVEIQWPVLSAERESFAHRPVKIDISDVEPTAVSNTRTHTRTDGSTIDFAEEGAHALGGKVALSSEHASGLPPPPLFGAESADLDEGDDGDEAWSFDPRALNSTLGDATDVTMTQRVDLTSGGTPETVKIRPVRRG